MEEAVLAGTSYYLEVKGRSIYVVVERCIIALGRLEQCMN